MRIVKLFLVAGIAASGFSVGAWAAVPSASQVLLIRPEAGRVEFDAVGKPSLLKIQGKGQGPQGEILFGEGKASGVLSFDLATLDTGIEMRNRHMKEKYLKVEQNPRASLELDPVALPSGWSLQKPEASEVVFSGKLNLAGVKKPVQGKFKVLPAGNGVGVEANFDVKISDFGIGIPSFAGITVADSVKVVVRIDRAEPRGASR